MPVCTHLEQYGAQFALAEATYRKCGGLVDAIRAEGPGEGRAGMVISALEEWRQQDARLRVQLVELAKSGRVRLPRRMVVKGVHRHAVGTQGTVICATCRRAVPRLKYAEWKFAHNGSVSFRGREFEVRQAISV
jgi:hypothetical protein